MATRLNRAKELNDEILKNKLELKARFGINDIHWQSNWSLNNFNSYLLAMKSLNMNKSLNFIDLSIILTDNTYSGLQKDGLICLNCHQVIQQWLNVGNFSFLLILIFIKFQLFLLKF